MRKHMIQVRNVPAPIQRTLKAKASLAGKSLSEFLLEEISALAERPSLDEIIERVKQLPAAVSPVTGWFEAYEENNDVFLQLAVDSGMFPHRPLL